MNLTSLLCGMLGALAWKTKPQNEVFCLFRFERDRYDSEDLLRQFARHRPRCVAGAWEWELEAEAGEICITLPDDHGTPSKAACAFAIEMLGHLREMDNQVQSSCEAECARTQLGPENYELAIGWVGIEQNNLSEQTVELCYYGLSVNTSWDAKFKRIAAGTWQPVNFGHRQ